MSAGLVVDDLHVTFRSGRRLLGARPPVRAVRGVTFALAPGECLALVGESGSGKSTTGRAIVRLLKPDRGRISLDGTDIARLRGRALREQRRRVQMIFQDSNSSLDPSMTIGRSIGEPIDVHLQLDRGARDDRVAELLTQVGLPRETFGRYPQTLSGGQRQRVAIARAIASDPRVVICDESLSGLDKTTEVQIVELLEALRDGSDVSYLLITHDLGVARRLATRIAVMYLGQIVELAPTEQLFAEPAHPYTRALLAAVPAVAPWVQRSRERLVLAGEMPDPSDPPPGCPFSSRCPQVMDVCRRDMPDVTARPDGGFVRCHLHA